MPTAMSIDYPARFFLIGWIRPNNSHESDAGRTG